jgi:hypothetical protein
MNMGFELRRANDKDVGNLAYMIFKWDGELPEEDRQVKTAVNAELAANRMLNNKEYITYILEEDDNAIGALCIIIVNGIWNPKPYGLLHLFVHKKYRNGKLIGFKLLKFSIEIAKEVGLLYLGMLPGVNDRGTNYVLSRLGFEHTNNGYVLPMGA